MRPLHCSVARLGWRYPKRCSYTLGDHAPNITCHGDATGADPPTGEGAVESDGGVASLGPARLRSWPGVAGPHGRIGHRVYVFSKGGSRRLSDFGLHKTLKIRTHGRVRRSLSGSPHLACYLLGMAKNSLDGEEDTKHGSLARFGPLRSVIPYFFGRLPLVEVGG